MIKIEFIPSHVTSASGQHNFTTPSLSFIFSKMGILIPHHELLECLYKQFSSVAVSTKVKAHALL